MKRAAKTKAPPEATVSLMRENALYEAECIRAFLAHVQLLTGCCYCTKKGQSVHRGRGAIERLACWMVDDAKKAPTFADCADMLSFLSNIELLSKSCFACDQDEKAVGHNVILDFVRESIREQLKASRKRKTS